MKEFLDVFFPRFLPYGLNYQLIAHQGKQDLQKSIPRKFRAWLVPLSRFIIVHDQDSADCKVLKRELTKVCNSVPNKPFRVRIVCRTLESWSLSKIDVLASSNKITNSAKFRNPDTVGNPMEELQKLVPSYSKTSGARLVGAEIWPAKNASVSFQRFASCVEEEVARLAFSMIESALKKESNSVQIKSFTQQEYQWNLLIESKTTGKQIVLSRDYTSPDKSHAGIELLINSNRKRIQVWDELLQACIQDLK